jgi:DNA invertase Pin-like site-specific DNA recombinase
MIPVRYEMRQKYRVVMYLRMSSIRQNERSPQQQADTIRREMRNLGVNWEVVATYTDSAVSGRLNRKRPEYQRMLRDLKSGAVRASLIVVDTFQRLTREKEAGDVRSKLQKLGVLVVTAESHFADPTSMAGKMLNMAESALATGEGETKAHNIERGKRDAFEQGYWAGGRVPFGYTLDDALDVSKGRSHHHHKLVPDSETSWIVKRMFQLADELGAGRDRVTRLINDDLQVPKHLKPFAPAHVGWILKNPIYFGYLHWGRVFTDVVDDVRVSEPRPERDQVRVENFCEALVAKEVFDRVNALRLARGKKQKKAREASRNRDAIPGLRAPGITLKYPLTGLVRCHHCRRAMAPVSSSPYVTKGGEERRYVVYACPAHAAGLCPNDCRIPEAWLRETVMQLLVERVFFGEEFSAA